MKLEITRLALGATGLLATAVEAGTAIADAEKAPEFGAIDADRNGYISTAEAESVPEISEIFATVDDNRDGQLNPSEWSKAVTRLQGLG
jgi:EF hand